MDIERNNGELTCKLNNFSEIVNNIFNQCETTEEIGWVKEELINCIKGSAEERVSNTLNIDAKILEIKYDILPTGDGRYYIPEHSTKTDFFSNKKKAEEFGVDTECTKLREVCFKELSVREGDVLVLTLEKKGYNFDSLISVWNCTNNTFGSFIGAYETDDSRLDVVNAVANKFRRVKNVVVCNYLIYTANETKNYINGIEELG